MNVRELFEVFRRSAEAAFEMRRRAESRPDSAEVARAWECLADAAYNLCAILERDCLMEKSGRQSSPATSRTSS
jgi:hypothetical protein